MELHLIIYSTPIRLCFCTPGPANTPNCSYMPPTVNVIKGEKLNVSLRPIVAVDQVNCTIVNTTIYVHLNSSDSSLIDTGQTEQTTKDGCTNLTYSILSKTPSVQLVLYAGGPCRNASLSQKRLNVSFKECERPLGFQVDHTDHDSICQCSCHP